MRLFVLVRHGQSELNVTHHVNGDPSVPVGLTEQGEAEAAALRVQLAGIELDLCVHTRFGRTRGDGEDRARGTRRCRSRSSRCSTTSTSASSRAGRSTTTGPGRASTRARDAFPGGESLDDAARRYADAYERLLARPEQRILVVCHEIPVRYAVNAAAGSDELDGARARDRQLHPAPLRRGRARAARSSGSAPSRRADPSPPLLLPVLAAAVVVAAIVVAALVAVAAVVASLRPRAL